MTNGSDELNRLREEIRSLTGHVAVLQNRVDALESTRTAPAPVSSQVSSDDEHIESRLGLIWVNRIGAITLAIGVLFLFKYAIDRQWITVWGRIVLGLLAGGVLCAASEWLLKRNQRVFSQGVYGCGVAVFYISLYFGFDEFRNGHPSIALEILILSIIFAALLFTGVRSNRIFLISFNAGWAILCTGLILHHSYPNGFAWFVLALAIVHFILASRTHSHLKTTLYVAGQACLLVTVVQWLVTWVRRETAAVDRLNVTSESLSFLFAIYAVIVILIGFAKGRVIDRLLGLLALGFVILKLYFYDIWLLDRLYRISAFVALGFLLLAASYLYSRWKDKLDALWTNRTR